MLFSFTHYITAWASTWPVRGAIWTVVQRQKNCCALAMHLPFKCTYTRKMFLYNPSFDLKLIPLYTNSYGHLQIWHRRGFCSKRLPERVLHKPPNVPPRLERVKCLAQTSSVARTPRALRATKICLLSAGNRVQLCWRRGLWPLGSFGWLDWLEGITLECPWWSLREVNTGLIPH